MAENANLPTAVVAERPRAQRRLFSVGIAGAIVAAIILLECGTVFYLTGRGQAENAAVPREIAAAEHAEVREVDLGKFSLTTLDANSSSSLLVEFQLIGSVIVDETGMDAKAVAECEHFGGQENQSADVAESINKTFEELFRDVKSRFRDQVIVIVGNAGVSVRSDPRCGLMKGQILARTNSLLGKPLLKEVRFSDFAVVEQ